MRTRAKVWLLWFSVSREYCREQYDLRHWVSIFWGKYMYFCTHDPKHSNPDLLEGPILDCAA